MTTIQKPHTVYNQEKSLSKSQRTRFNKVISLFNIKNISETSIKLIHTIINEMNGVVFGNDKLSKKFNTTINSILKTHTQLVDSEINTLYEIFKLIQEKNFNYVNVVKSGKHVSTKKKTVEEYLINLIVSDNELENSELQRFRNTIQNTNHFTHYFYTTITQKLLSDNEIVESMRKLLGGYQQTNSTTLINLSGAKSTFVGSVQNVVNEHINMSKVNQLIVPFGGSGTDFINVTPLLNPNTKVILNSINETNSQLFIDIQLNRKELIEQVIDMEIEYTKLISGVHCQKRKLKISQKFFKKHHERLNQLEEQGDYGLETSSLFVFLGNKTFGGNMEWEEGKTTISKGSDLRKYEKSVISKIEHFGYWLDKFDVVVENEDFSTVLDKYDNENSLTISDPLYVKENESELLQTSVTFGNGNFPHRKCVDYTLNLKGQFIYHNYNNSKLVELFDRKDIGVVEHRKTIFNGRSEKGVEKPKCVELIFFSKEKQPVVFNNPTFEPLKQVS